jgi:DNA-binding response OmpR family regulator
MAASVLIVEEDAALRTGMTALMKMRGHRSVASATVIEAHSHLDAATPTHLLLDLNLPDGTGTTILRRIRDRGLPVRVALLSGGNDTPLTDEARAIGVDAVFVKPPDWDKLLEWIDQP